MSSRKTDERSQAPARPASLSTSRSASSGSKESSPVDKKSQIDFQFLNFSHPSEAKASRARRTVRSHVTKQQHQREHAAAAARREHRLSQPDLLTTYPDQRASTLELPSQTSTAPSSGEGSSPSQSPPRGASPGSDPDQRLELASVYPEEWHPYLPRIMKHYLANMAVDIPDLDGPEAKGLLRTRFFPFVLTDAAPLHAVMLMAASHYGNMRSTRAHTIDLLQLRGMAISEINTALTDERRATSDQLIAAVGKMAQYEALFGDRDIFNTHMTGLLRMVTLRGGLPALGLDGLLERILLWIDINSATLLGTHVYFDSAAFPSAAEHPRPDPQRFAGGLA